jgi:hypothetical protein
VDEFFCGIEDRGEEVDEGGAELFEVAVEEEEEGNAADAATANARLGRIVS